jgi:putative acetyltransferase
MAPAIRAEATGDATAIRRVHELAFGQPDEARLVDALRGSEAWLPEFSLVAEEGEEVVGHVLLSRIWLTGPAGSSPAVALAPVAVLPRRQRQGIGAALVRAAIDTAQRRGERLIVVLGDPEYYGRFGFRAARSHGVTGPYDVPDPVFAVLPLAAYDPSRDRGRVDYPAAFGGLDA